MSVILSDGLYLGNYPAGPACPFWPLPCIYYQCFKYAHPNIIERYKHRIPAQNITAIEKQMIADCCRSGDLKNPFVQIALGKLSPIQQEALFRYHGIPYKINSVNELGQHCTKCNCYNEYQIEPFTCYSCRNGL